MWLKTREMTIKANRLKLSTPVIYCCKTSEATTRSQWRSAFIKELTITNYATYSSNWSWVADLTLEVRTLVCQHIPKSSIMLVSQYLWFVSDVENHRTV